MINYYGNKVYKLEEQFNTLFQNKILKYSLSIDNNTGLLSLELFNNTPINCKFSKICEINFTKFGSIIMVKNFLYKNDIKNEKIYDDIVKIIGGLYE